MGNIMDNYHPGNTFIFFAGSAIFLKCTVFVDSRFHL